MDAFLRCITWDNHYPLEKQLGFRTVTAPSQGQVEVLRCSPEWGSLADGKLWVLWAELRSHPHSYIEVLTPTSRI